MTKGFLTASATLLCASIMFHGVPAVASGAYKCTAKTSFGKMTLTFKNGRARGGGFTFQSKILGDGSVRLSYIGESAFLGADGQVRGRGGAQTGPHSCDMAKVHAALKK